MEADAEIRERIEREFDLYMTARGSRQVAETPCAGRPAVSLWPAPRPPRSPAQRIDPRKGQRWPTPFPGRPALNAPLPPWRRRHEAPFSPAGPSWLSPSGRGSWKRLRQTARRDPWQRRWRSTARPACAGRGRKNKAVKLAGTKALPMSGGHGYRLLRPRPAPRGSCRRYPARLRSL